MASVQDGDAAPRFKMRFSIRRFEKVIKSLSKRQRDILVKHGFGILLNIKYQAAFPLHLIDWMMMNMVPSLAVFEHENKRIYFTKGMVQQFLGIYSGEIPVKMSSDDPDIIAQVKILKEKYMSGTKISTKRALDLLAGDEDDLSFLRSFMLVFLAMIICPATSDTVDWRYLYSMTDLATIRSTDWCSLCLQCLLVEAKKFQKKILRNGTPNQPLNVGGCLPLLPVTYIDYLDLNANAVHYQIQYGVPRIYHVCTSDFRFVMNIDRVPNPTRVVFEALKFRQHSSTPYCDSAIKVSMEEFRRNQLALHSLGVDSSGCSSRKQPISSHPNSAPHIKELIDSIVQSHKAEFIRDVDKLVQSRFCKMSQSIYSELSEQGLAFANCAPVEIPANSTEVRTDVIVPLTSIIAAGKPEVSIPVGSQSNHSKRRSSARGKDKVVGDECTPIPNHGQRRSPRFLRDDTTPVSIQSPALGIQLPKFHASGHSSMPVFDWSPIGFDASTSFGSKAADLPVFDNSPLLIDSSGVCFNDYPHSGPITTCKKKRKRSNVKTPCFSNAVFNLSSSQAAEEFYQKYLENKFIKSLKEREGTVVVDINGHTVSYEHFYQSLKPRGDVSNTLMAAYVELFNKRPLTKSRVNISFSPYFAKYFATKRSLNVPPERFDVKSVSRDLRMLNKEYNLAKCDLLHLPLVHGFHWRLICINLLFKNISVLDSLQHVDSVNKSITVTNMVTNFQSACIESKCIDIDLAEFEHVYPDNVPQQTNQFDCGVFVMLFMGRFTGQGFEEFGPESVIEFRKFVAHDIATSSLNDMTTESEFFKKLKLT